jgi:hypothetical protein
LDVGFLGILDVGFFLDAGSRVGFWDLGSGFGFGSGFSVFYRMMDRFGLSDLGC